MESRHQAVLEPLLRCILAGNGAAAADLHPAIGHQAIIMAQHTCIGQHHMGIQAICLDFLWGQRPCHY